MMDTSEQYIKMSDELPASFYRGSRTGDWAYDSNEKIVFLCLDTERVQEVYHYRDYPDRSSFRHHTIPLYRQDQLQEMLMAAELLGDIWTVHDEFDNFCHENYVGGKNTYGSWNDYTGNLCSFEQLWLAFAMKVEYGKVWDGENWV